MLESHYRFHNRTITFRELAKSAGAQYESNKLADFEYGKLVLALGKALDFPFTDLDDHSGKPFCSNAIGMGMPATYSSSNDLQLVMHHALAIALGELDQEGGFKE